MSECRATTWSVITLWLCIAGAGNVHAQPVVPVEVARAVIVPVVTEIPLTGTVTARDHARLSARMDGLVSAVHVTAGDRVAQGTLLLSLDPTLEQLALVEAKAASAEARAALDEARRVRDEARRLGPKKGIPESEIRAAEAQVKIAETKLERLLAAERYKLELIVRHDLYAPFAGVVAQRLAEVGEWVDTGTPVLELVGTEHLRLDLRVPQEHYPYLDTDTEVTLLSVDETARMSYGVPEAAQPIKTGIAPETAPTASEISSAA